MSGVKRVPGSSEEGGVECDGAVARVPNGENRQRLAPELASQALYSAFDDLRTFMGMYV